MLGLGVSLTSATAAESSQGARLPAPLTDWTVTTLGSITTPMATLDGTLRASNVGAWFDEANDWTGTLADYDGVGLVIYNVTDDITHNYGNFKFNVNGGALITVHLIQLSGVNVQSLVSAAAGKTVRVTFTLSLDGYNDVELTAEKTY